VSVEKLSLFRRSGARMFSVLKKSVGSMMNYMLSRICWLCSVCTKTVNGWGCIGGGVEVRYV